MIFRLLLIGFVVQGVAPSFARANSWSDDDDDDWGDDDDDDDDDKGGDDFGFDDDDDDGEPQPAVTAGGLYTKKSWPIAELDRNLTLLGGMTEGLAGLGIDISNQGAFERWFLDVQGRYGIKDWSQIELGVQALLAGDLSDMELGTFNQARLDAFYEHAIQFNLVDFRLGAEMPINPDAQDSFLFNIVFGFPFRYKPKPKVAVVALEELMTIHTNGDKPDLTPAIGVEIQAAPPLALLLRAQAIISGFNFDSTIAIPATAAVQFTPKRAVDLGLEFTFLNLNAKGVDDMGMETSAPFDNRFLLLYGQFRI